MEPVRVDMQIRRLTVGALEVLQFPICSKCQSQFRVRDYVVGLSCGHGYHRDCFNTWSNEVILQGKASGMP